MKEPALAHLIRAGVAVLVAVILSAAPAATAQQAVDTGYDPKVAQPAYSGSGPAVAIDEAHRNFHTMAGRYGPFARLIAADGYRGSPSSAPFSPDALRGVDILVIANARLPQGGGPAFAEAEIAAVKAWVEAGGSLFLISDHAPFGTAAAPLARALGVEMGQGYVVVREGRTLTSQIEFEGSRLADHPILAGRNPNERARRVRSFTGQSLGVPPGGSGLLMLPGDALEVAGTDEMEALNRGQSVPARRVGDRAQCIAFTLGKGRVVVAGEAAMFTAQRVDLPGGNRRVGLTVEDDQRFALNVMHWLSRALP